MSRLYLAGFDKQYGADDPGNDLYSAAPTRDHLD